MLTEQAVNMFGLMLVTAGISGGIFYVVGLMHEREKQEELNKFEGPPEGLMFKCCDHCYHPVTGKHYGPADSDLIHFRPDTHSVGCTEADCIKGNQVVV